MSQQKTVAPPPSLNVQDILYVLFKHKWKILVSAAIGIGAAAFVFFTYPTTYETQAKLLVRYVVDTSTIDQVDSRSTIGSASKSVINSEVEILTSWDLAMQVAAAVGIERLLPGAGGSADISLAARSIRLGLTVTALSDTNIILVSYKNRDPALAGLVLKEILTRYFAKHLEVHRSADAFNFVSQQSDEVRASLNQTEEELKRLKDKVGITSLSESTTILNTELSKTREALKAGETEHAEQQALLQELGKPLPGEDKLANDDQASVTGEVVQQYQALISRLANLRQMDLELTSKYAQKAEQPQALDEVRRSRQVRPQNSQPAAPVNNTITDPIGFIGAERDSAQALARERYRRQNDTGFSYQMGKKSFDTLVKEAEQDIIKQKINNSLAYKASDDELEKLGHVQKLNQVQIENLEKQRSDLERKYPGLAAVFPSASSENDQSYFSARRSRLTEVFNGRARLAGIEARCEALKSHLRDLESQIKQLSDVGPQIVQLERAKEIAEKNYTYFQASLEKARIDEALDPSKMPNISVIQSPSTAFKTSRELKKLVLGLSAGGVGLGLAFSFLIELLVDRKRQATA